MIEEQQTESSIDHVVLFLSLSVGSSAIQRLTRLACSTRAVCLVGLDSTGDGQGQKVRRDVLSDDMHLFWDRFIIDEES
jgi:hypothetical protein